mgnify:CR=1 FL=1
MYGERLGRAGFEVAGRDRRRLARSAQAVQAAQARLGVKRGRERLARIGVEGRIGGD